MAEELQFIGTLEQTGLTVVARVYNNSGVQTGGDIACPEIGTDAIYIADMPAVAAGLYTVRFVADGSQLGAGTIEWDGAAEITLATIDTVADANAAAIASLNDFNPATDTVARVTLVDTTTANTDMRGTDNANTIAPDNSAIAAAIASLNDFDPATDTVARVTLVDTTTTNTDMRGTDNANTIAPDNSAIAGNTAAIASLNNLSVGDVAGAVPTATQIASEVQAGILNEGDGQQVIDAIVQAIGNENVTAATIAAQVRTELTPELGRIDAGISTRLAASDYAETPSVVDANIVSVNAVPVDGDGSDSNPFGPA